MPLIKRYPNRKLYDTVARRYITLEEIAKLVQGGEDVKVIDHASGMDLTELTLSQVVYELQKKKRRFLPHSLLAALIHDAVPPVSRVVGSFGLNELVAAEIQRRIEALVTGGELTAEEGSLWLNKLLSNAPDQAETHSPWSYPGPFTPEQIEQVIQRLPIPSRKEFRKLEEQLHQLEAALEQIKPPDTPDDPPEAND
ncbi:MAG TPA: polyhydroxyalkanoate synthesis regulator DNA-binding domain-containing protein [Anaerolineales bacterium]|nr:polyhydroxyalkanoate synthesis regulator DNA-binding domain-containing protein [Anaerolineales bacterium]